VTLMVHLASVWVPFTSESKEAIAAYPEIEKEIRLALQAVGRKLGIFLKRRQKVKQEGERRSVFMRYLAEVAGAVSDLNGSDREEIHSNLLRVANRVTKVADTKFDEGGNKIQEDENFGDNVLIVEQGDPEEALKQRLLEGNPQQKLF
ncbi:MAG TPA: DNA topoisomerase VI subunit B, partial [Planctomycetaceae bacterium]|nr:DNA topoisomerase VI subunit B [Planctomycetaceae bacterium]